MTAIVGHMPSPDYSGLPDAARWFLEPGTMLYEKGTEAVVEAVCGEEAKESLKESRKEAREARKHVGFFGPLM